MDSSTIEEVLVWKKEVELLSNGLVIFLHFCGRLTGSTLDCMDMKIAAVMSVHSESIHKPK
jgi:hypothetical protein